jgi:hypothetical protein
MLIHAHTVLYEAFGGTLGGCLALALAFSLCLQEAVIVGLEERGKYMQGMVPTISMKSWKKECLMSAHTHGQLFQHLLFLQC